MKQKSAFGFPRWREERGWGGRRRRRGSCKIPGTKGEGHPSLIHLANQIYLRPSFSFQWTLALGGSIKAYSSKATHGPASVQPRASSSASSVVGRHQFDHLACLSHHKQCPVCLSRAKQNTLTLQTSPARRNALPYTAGEGPTPFPSSEHSSREDPVLSPRLGIIMIVVPNMCGGGGCL